MKKTVTICFANNKGGSGKSTTCGNVGYYLAQQGKKVLLLDGDMQLNLSLSFFTEEDVLAMAQGQANAYITHENEKFLLYSIDWMCVILIALLGIWGLLGALFFQMAQLGSFLSRHRIRAFVSQKLFFFAFPAGLVTYRRRSRAYEAA